MRHYLLAGAYADAVRVILPYRAGRLTAQRAYLFRDLVRRLPPPVAQAHPWLLRTAASSCRFVGDYEQALAWSRQALAASEDVDADLWAHAVAGVSMSMYVSDVKEVERLVGGDKARPLVLYCNGPFCGKSKRLSEELLAAGFTSVRRYQLGIPVWRALVGLCEIELEAVQHVLERDRTAVFLDARSAEEFAAGSLPGARSIPQSAVEPGKDVGEVRKAKDDGRLPMEDHNTRIVVFGRDGVQARGLAEALAREAFHNVAYFPGPFEALRRAVR